MKKIGLYFGSFNPIHIGHLAIANYMTEFSSDLDHIWFVISPQNPLKKKSTILANHHRLYLAELAIGNDPELEASDIEFYLPRPSYTINTLAYLKERYPSNRFALIMGADNLSTISKWKNHDLLLEKYEIYVYPRPGYPTDKIGADKNILENAKIHIVDAPLIEISSSFIRTSIKEGKNIRYFLPPKVYEYIREMHFYEK
jgi:nicotinate-nucleotide adenylyltransferase